MKTLEAKMTEIVENYLTHYKNDFYTHDIKKLKTMTEGIWSIRKTGTDITDTKEIFKSEYIADLERIRTDEEINGVIIWHERNERFFEISGNNLTEITKDKAISILKDKVKKELFRHTEAKKRLMQIDYN